MQVLKAIIVGLIVGVAFVLAIPPAEASEGESFECYGSWYGPGLYGNLTASGVEYWGQDDIVAHPSLPFGTVLYVETEFGSDYVTVQDRGPYVAGRCLDFSTSDSWIVGDAVAWVYAEVVYSP